MLLHEVHALFLVLDTHESDELGAVELRDERGVRFFAKELRLPRPEAFPDAHDELRRAL